MLLFIKVDSYRELRKKTFLLCVLFLIFPWPFSPISNNIHRDILSATTKQDTCNFKKIFYSFYLKEHSISSKMIPLMCKLHAALQSYDKNRSLFLSIFFVFFPYIHVYLEMHSPSKCPVLLWWGTTWMQ